MADSRSTENIIRFLLNGELVETTNVEPTKSVLHYIREEQRLTGAKEGCAEGDCGACTVVVAELAKTLEHEDKVELKTVNACIQFVPTLHGKAVFTVEYLRQANGDLHPVQQAMIEEHGSQCGFCTPGFIMSLWNLYNNSIENQQKPSAIETKNALTGNLCRCTGYRPILCAAKHMFDLPEVDFDQTTLVQQLRDLRPPSSLDYKHDDSHFFSPTSLDELLTLKEKNPSATILAGGTDVGLWVNKQFREINPVIYLGNVRELKQITTDDNKIVIGAGASLTDTYQAISSHYPEMDQMWDRFASLPIRNAGTLGGNVANGSPIGDSMPALIALDAEVILRSQSKSRTLLLEDLYLDYMKKDLREDEIVEAIHLPLPKKQQQFRCYKLSKRHDSDISAVFAAFAISLEGNTIAHCKIAYGGMAATPKRALETEQVLFNSEWNEHIVQEAMKALDKDFSPLSDMRASDKNRQQSAASRRIYMCLAKQPMLMIFQRSAVHILRL